MSTDLNQMYNIKIKTRSTLQLQQSIQRLETERDHYRKEYINCREEQRRASEKDNVRLKSAAKIEGSRLSRCLIFSIKCIGGPVDANLRIEARIERQGASIEQSATGEGRAVVREGESGSAIADLQGPAEADVRPLQIVQFVQTCPRLHLRVRFADIRRRY